MSEICCPHCPDSSCDPDSTLRFAHVSPEILLSLVAAPLAVFFWLRGNLHLPPPPPPQPPGLESEQLPPAIPKDGGSKAPVVYSSTPHARTLLQAESWHSGGSGSSSGSDSDDDGSCPAGRAAARRFGYPPIWYIEGAGNGAHPESMGRVRGSPYVASTPATVGRSGGTDGTLNHMVDALLSGSLLDIHSSDESTIHPANGLLIHALKDLCANTETVAAGVEPYSQMLDCWVSKLEEDAERLCPGEGRKYIFLLNNMYDAWQCLRRPGASFSNAELVSRLISMIQRYRRDYLDVCWIPLNKQRRGLSRFTAEFLVITGDQMTWKVTAELRYNLRQEIVDLIVPPYELCLLAMHANRSRLRVALSSLKRVMTGKKKQKKYTGEELEKVIRELFEG